MRDELAVLRDGLSLTSLPNLVANGKERAESAGVEGGIIPYKYEYLQQLASKI